jgi:hypothetical protein
LNTNQLEGSIPARLGDLKQLASLALYSNRLEGTIPAELAALERLVYLGLDRNRLTGVVPNLPFKNYTSYCRLQTPTGPANTYTCPLPPDSGTCAQGPPTCTGTTTTPPTTTAPTTTVSPSATAVPSTTAAPTTTTAPATTTTTTTAAPLTASPTSAPALTSPVAASPPVAAIAIGGMVAVAAVAAAWLFYSRRRRQLRKSRRAGASGDLADPLLENELGSSSIELGSTAEHTIASDTSATSFGGCTSPPAALSGASAGPPPSTAGAFAEVELQDSSGYTSNTGSSGASVPASPAAPVAQPEYDDTTGAPVNAAAKKAVAREWRTPVPPGARPRVVRLPVGLLQRVTDDFNESNQVADSSRLAPSHTNGWRRPTRR